MPPQKEKVPVCSTVSVVNPSRPTQFDVHRLGLPVQVIAGWTKLLEAKLNFLAAVAA